MEILSIYCLVALALGLVYQISLVEVGKLSTSGFVGSLLLSTLPFAYLALHTLTH